jgi:hypothetical protein
MFKIMKILLKDLGRFGTVGSNKEVQNMGSAKLNQT